MKLYKKLFLQVFLGILLMSQCTFLYFLHVSREQSLHDVREYESSVLQKKMRVFEKDRNQEEMFGDSGYLKAAAAAAFGQQFQLNAALYLEGEEIYNKTPFTFDCTELRRRAEKVSPAGSDVLCVPQSIGKRKLLFFFDMGWILSRESESVKYEVISYTDVSDIYERSENLFFQGLGFTALMVLALGFLLYRGLHFTLRPLTELGDAASRIAGGEYGVRVSVRGKDEIAGLAESFNTMAEKVEEHVEALSKSNESRRQLLGSLAHELKTPMTAIIGYADTLLTVRLGERHREQALHYIESECRRLSRLSAKMMELTGLYESGEEETILRKEESVGALLERLKDLTAYRLGEKGMELQVSCLPGLKRSMDADLMMSLLMNLVDNACKAQTGGQILVSADEEKITVEDFGKGIPKEEIGRITEAFYMVDKARSKREGGIGLGLALCSRIAEIHGAKLVIESEEGRGTRVHVCWEVNQCHLLNDNLTHQPHRYSGVDAPIGPSPEHYGG